jgi:hypothetical protein
MQIRIEEGGSVWTVEAGDLATRALASERSVHHAPDQAIALLTIWERQPAPIEQVVIYWLRQMHWDDVAEALQPVGEAAPIQNLRDAAFSVEAP